jgi:hypothetical protein
VNFAAAERCDGFIARSALVSGTEQHTWGTPVAMVPGAME